MTAPVVDKRRFAARTRQWVLALALALAIAAAGAAAAELLDLGGLHFLGALASLAGLLALVLRRPAGVWADDDDSLVTDRRRGPRLLLTLAGALGLWLAGGQLLALTYTSGDASIFEQLGEMMWRLPTILWAPVLTALWAVPLARLILPPR